MNNSSLTRLTVIIIVSLHDGGEQETNVIAGDLDGARGMEMSL